MFDVDCKLVEAIQKISKILKGLLNIKSLKNNRPIMDSKSEWGWGLWPLAVQMHLDYSLEINLGRDTQGLVQPIDDYRTVVKTQS